MLLVAAAKLAWPLAIVAAIGLGEMLAPLAGPVRVMRPPLTGSPKSLVTPTTMSLKAVPMSAA